MNRTVRAALAVGAAVAALAACTSTSPGDPTSAPTTSEDVPTSTSPDSGGGGGLNLQKYLSDPCAILTKEQQAGLATFREATAGEDGPNGPSCTYQGKDVLADSTFKVILVVKGNTIEDFIESTKSGMSISEETEVEGRRAVSFDSADGKRTCNTAVGTSDREAVLVQGSIGKNDKLNDGKACGTTERVAATVIGNLKKG
ncbi:DUF3558 domain-containing protein [Saccharothrix algeriensis]|uniref:DUF3558 domain-containing protein n=1 Tax=Saccharothrix algeriensis TaxID=173560 RepID=A0A8T8I2B1_9PSEU|nr:DUF3558 domain-containing protein [Saccharothrix algeriensis]MBM7811103.1 surface antigen [Saccharothrix algeriensis]QTR05043.1 DUF3558 domain-containing protein [Saccharothrix algeriensis]